MKKYTPLIIFLVLAITKTQAQDYLISFAGIGNTTTVSSVYVENLTSGASVTLYGSDNLHLSSATGIDDPDINNENLQVYPNPMQGQTEISFYAKQTGHATISIYNIAGIEVLQTEDKLSQGIQKYRLSGLKQGMYVVNISGAGYVYTSKLISYNATTSEAVIKNMGTDKPETFSLKSTKATVSMPYTMGDNLRYTGYAGNLTSIIYDVPTSSKTISFPFSSSITLTTVSIPAGTFTMGSAITEIGRDDDETQHQVTLSAFRISTYEITNAQFAAFLNAKGIGSDGLYAAGSYPAQQLIYATNYGTDWGLHYSNYQWIPAAGYESHPVIFASWYGATEFATYAGGRLPTEAEWEYACRAGTTTPFNTGNCLTEAQANYNWADLRNYCTNTNTTSPGKTQEVGTYPANAYGLYDMHGNVLEWCSDWYGPYESSPQTNPSGNASGMGRVFRGGSWTLYAAYCRSADRMYDIPGEESPSIGFRVVLVNNQDTSVPFITTEAINNISLTTARCGGNITSDGGATVTGRGVCWSTNITPSISDSKTTDGIGTGSFTSNIAGLSQNTIYYVRAYATNSHGTGYGSAISFTTLQVGGSINITTVPIPAGTFTMGSPLTEVARYNDETQHQVTLSAFRMSKYEITNAQFAAFLNAKSIGSNGIYTAGAFPADTLIYASTGSYNWGLHYSNNQWISMAGYENYPVIEVTWYGATEFATYVGGRLPTEAEWEYACRAGITTPFNTGNCLTDAQANYNWAYPYSGCTNTDVTYPGKTQEVGSYPANAFGLHDMHGNVMEWCSDWYSDYPVTAQTNPTGPAVGDFRLLRGGSWAFRGPECRSALRLLTTRLGIHSEDEGFRVVLVNNQNSSVPVVTTEVISNISQTTATCGGNITSDGEATVTGRGVCWSTNITPTLSDSKTVDGLGTGSFTSAISGLTSNTTYYVRAYATNSSGTGYGSAISFKTLQGGASSLATLTTLAISNITQNSASCGGTITSDGGSPITARGVCWSTTTNPTISSSTRTTDGTGTGGFISSIVGLSVGTKYYVRAFATNSAGTAYGYEVTFTIGVGVSYQGGRIAYIFQPGDLGYLAGQVHGLIAAPTDMSVGMIQWYNGSYITTGATGQALGTGYANTNAIVSSQGAGNYAAKLCADLVLGGYSDWFLPSFQELARLYYIPNDPPIYIGPHWSSTETSANEAIYMIDDYTFVNPLDKKQSALVRAFRAF